MRRFSWTILLLSAAGFAEQRRLIFRGDDLEQISLVIAAVKTSTLRAETYQLILIRLCHEHLFIVLGVDVTGIEKSGVCKSTPVGAYCNRRLIFDIKILTIECWHLPIFTARRQTTIFGTTGLNFRVRYGNGWTPCVINTNC